MPLMRKNVVKPGCAEVGCKEQSEVDIEFHGRVMDSKVQLNSSFQFGICNGDYKGFGARDQLQCQQKLSLSPKKPVIGSREANYKGFVAHDQLQYDQKLSLSPRQSIEKRDGYYKGVNAHDQLQYVRKFSLPSYQEPLIDNRDERYQLHEDYLHPRLVYTKELDRGRDKVWRKFTASYCDEQVGSSREIGHMCRDCDSRKFNGEIDCSRLHQDVFRYNNCRLDDLYFNEIQSDVGQLESRKRYTSGETDLNWAIDKDHEDYQHRSSDLNNSRNVTITTPRRRKGIRLCKKFLKGKCKRGASCWYVHDVAGRYHRDHINYKVSERGGPFSSDNSLAKDNFLANDGYLYSEDILKSHSSKNRYKRYIPRDGDADRLFKKCCTEATRRHEDRDYFEESGRIFRDSISSGGTPFHCKRTELPCEVRRGSESVTEDSYLGISSDESLDMSESNGVIRRQRLKIRRGEFSDGYESMDSISESSDLNTNRRTKEMSAHSEKPLAGKRSRRDSFLPEATLGNRNSPSTKKHCSFKRGKNYYPDGNRLPHKDKGTVLCKYYMKGYCCRGYRCLFSHGTDCSDTYVGMDECKSSVTKRNSVAINEIPHSQDLSSTNNTKRSHQKKVRNIGVGGIDKSMHFKSSTEHSCATTSSAKTFSGKKCTSDTDKDIQLDNVKKGSGTQEVALYRGTKNCPVISVEKKIAAKYGKKKEPVDSVKVTCGNQICKVDDGCDTCLMGRADEKHSSVKHIVRKKSATDPSLLNQQNLVPEPPSSNLGSFSNVGQPEEAFKGSDVVDQSSHPSASPKQRICIVIGNESRPASCPTPNKECLPCLLENVDGFLDKNGVKLTSQPLSSGSKVEASPKSSLPNDQRFISDASVEMPLGHQLELQQRCSSLGEFMSNSQSLSNLIDKKINSCQTPTCGVNGSFEIVDEEDSTQGERGPDTFVGYNNLCGVQKLEDNNDRINNRALGSCEINQNRFIDQVEEGMLVREKAPLASIVNSAVSFPVPAREDVSVDEIGLDMSLDHYIYTTLSLEHYASHMEYDNITTHHSSCKEHGSFVEDTHVGVRSDNLIQHCNIYSSLPTFDGISETKHFGSSAYSAGLSPTRIVWSEVEETVREPNLEQHENIRSKEQEEIHAVKLEPIKVRTLCMEEMPPHVNKEPNPSQKERIMTPKSSDKQCESLHVDETVETELMSSFIGKGSDFKKNIRECGDMPFSSHAKRCESQVSEQIRETQVLNPKEPAAVFEDEKCSSVVDSHEARGSNEASVNCNEGDEDGKLLLRLAVLELAKEILGPLWKAGRITSKEIYKTITRKVVNKVCGYVQGVNIPRTKENVDRYLMPRKPKIAQLVLAYVNMYPVQL